MSPHVFGTADRCRLNNKMFFATSLSQQRTFDKKVRKKRCPETLQTSERAIVYWLTVKTGRGIFSREEMPCSAIARAPTFSITEKEATVSPSCCKQRQAIKPTTATNNMARKFLTFSIYAIQEYSIRK